MGHVSIFQGRIPFQRPVQPLLTIIYRTGMVVIYLEGWDKGNM
jgi:hypothetical protein